MELSCLTMVSCENLFDDGVDVGLGVVACVGADEDVFDQNGPFFRYFQMGFAAKIAGFFDPILFFF